MADEEHLGPVIYEGEPGSRKNVPLKGIDGAAFVFVKDYVVKESFSQEDENIVDNVYTVPGGVRQGFEIKNKGESPLTYTIGTITIELDAGESSSDAFDDFNTIEFSVGAIFKAKTFGLRG